MNFRKQSDGLSWLITEPDGDGVRKLAVVTINESLSEPRPEIQMIDATADEEIAVRETAQKILKRWADDKLKLCVATEDESSYSYISMLVKALGLSERVDVMPTFPDTAAGAYERLAKEMLWQDVSGKRVWSEVWLVFGKDSFPLEILPADVTAKFPFMHTVLSKPSFEYWQLLHLKEFDGSLPCDRVTTERVSVTEERIGPDTYRVVSTDRVVRSASADACRAKLAELCPGNSLRSEGCLQLAGSGLGLALERAAQLNPENSDNLTEMPALFERLCRLARKKPSEGLRIITEKAEETVRARQAWLEKAQQSAAEDNTGNSIQPPEPSESVLQTGTEADVLSSEAVAADGQDKSLPSSQAESSEPDAVDSPTDQTAEVSSVTVTDIAYSAKSGDEANPPAAAPDASVPPTAANEDGSVNETQTASTEGLDVSAEMLHSMQFVYDVAGRFGRKPTYDLNPEDRRITIAQTDALSRWGEAVFKQLSGKPYEMPRQLAAGLRTVQGIKPTGSRLIFMKSVLSLRNALSPILRKPAARTAVNIGVALGHLLVCKAWLEAREKEDAEVKLRKKGG